jgi:hypothetical protein
MRMKAVVCLAAFCAASSLGGGFAWAQSADAPPPPPKEKKKRLLIGPEYGSWRPTDARVRKLFGSTWQNIGIGFGEVSAPRDKGELQPGLRIVRASGGENRITLVPVGVTWRKGFGTGGSYLGLSGNALFGRLEGPTLSGKWKTGAGGALFLGQSFGKKAYFEAGYSAYGKLEGYDVSGWNLSAGFRF